MKKNKAICLSPTQEKEFEVEKTIFRIFLKHIKAHKLYMAFRWAVNRENAKKDLIHVLSYNLLRRKYMASSERMGRLGNAFSIARSYHDILRILHGERGKHKVENSKEFQMSIMNIVNMLLHNCIEHAVVENDFKLLEEIGSSIFEESCKTLIGDSFEDMTLEMIDPREREFLARMQEMASQGYRTPSKELLKHIQSIVNERMSHMDNDARFLNYFDYDDYDVGKIYGF